MDRLQQLQNCGQSYWLDNLTRRMIHNGELQERVTKTGLRGVTSNPNTFHKAISETNDYDEHISRLVRRQTPTTELYERLVVADVQAACDLLRPVYDETEGGDGFVSLEVSPHLAHDADGTMQEARRLWALVGRPNVLIKIPGTAAGVPAIEQMLYEGVNVNITLLFSVPRYEAVAVAYINALERRITAGRSVREVASVASFFLSRIDVLVDQLLHHRLLPQNRKGNGPYPEALVGRVAIANAKLAYDRFRQLFCGERWQALTSNGARVQRPLWASTSTKNPRYSDVRYIEPLIGPSTVTTMPEETMSAFADHGEVKANTVMEEVGEARQVFRDLGTLGVDFGCVTWQLENEGVQKFLEPYDALMSILLKTQA
ncbi:MAG: transaldolase [Candidatus Binatia bacterium]